MYAPLESHANHMDAGTDYRPDTDVDAPGWVGSGYDALSPEEDGEPDIVDTLPETSEPSAASPPRPESLHEDRPGDRLGPAYHNYNEIEVQRTVWDSLTTTLELNPAAYSGSNVVSGNPDMLVSRWDFHDLDLDTAVYLRLTVRGFVSQAALAAGTPEAQELLEAMRLIEDPSRTVLTRRDMPRDLLGVCRPVRLGSLPADVLRTRVAQIVPQYLGSCAIGEEEIRAGRVVRRCQAVEYAENPHLPGANLSPRIPHNQFGRLDRALGIMDQARTLPGLGDYPSLAA